MPRQVFLANGSRVAYDAQHPVGEGGLAEVYRIIAPQRSPGQETVLKLFKVSTDSEFDSDSRMRTGLDIAHRERQSRLPELLKLSPRMPAHAVMPTALVYDEYRQVIGCELPFIRSEGTLEKLSVPDERKKLGLSVNTVIKQLLSLHKTVSALHARGVIIGDFTGNNVLARGDEAFVIDADTFQFGAYRTMEYTPHYVDPSNCDPSLEEMIAVRPHSFASDWYAFAVIAFRTLCMTDPYGGTYRPADKAKRIGKDALRRFRHVTVYDPEVRYPKAGTHYSILPDDLNAYFVNAFVRDVRLPMPVELLEDLRAVTCRCGTDHLRLRCPQCNALSIRARQVFKTEGQILLAALDRNGKPCVITSSKGRVNREDGSVVFAGKLARNERLALWNRKTMIIRPEIMEIHGPDQSITRIPVTASGENAIVDANATCCVWLEGGKLIHHTGRAFTSLPNAPADVTQVWTNSTHGLGLTAASSGIKLQAAFTFDFETKTISRPIPLHRFWESISEPTCFFIGKRTWLFFDRQRFNQVDHRYMILRSDGSIEAQGTLPSALTPWIRGACSRGASDFLLCPTPEGVKRISLIDGNLVSAPYLPETRTFMEEGTRLLADGSNTFIVRHQDIIRLGA